MQEAAEFLALIAKRSVVGFGLDGDEHVAEAVSGTLLQFVADSAEWLAVDGDDAEHHPVMDVMLSICDVKNIHLVVYFHSEDTISGTHSTPYTCARVHHFPCFWKIKTSLKRNQTVSVFYNSTLAKIKHQSSPIHLHVQPCICQSRLYNEFRG
jgi:hypothetical protein